MKLKKLASIGTLLVSIFSTYDVTAGYIVVNNDEWTLSNTGYTEAGSDNAHNFIRNITNLFTGDTSGNFLALTNNFGVNESKFADSMTKLGHTWTQNGQATSTTNFSDYDAIFLGGYFAFDTQDVIDYVEQGGSAYIMAGTAKNISAKNEANFWNPILQKVGLEFEEHYNGIAGTSVPTVNRLTQDVDQLYFASGNSIVDNDLNNDTTNGEILFSLGDEGMLAVGSFGTMPPTSRYTPTPVSTPATFGLFIFALGLLAARRRVK